MAALVVCLAALAAFAVAARRTIVREIAARWLAHHGIEGEVEIEVVERDRISGRIRLGPADAPSLHARTFDVKLEIRADWAALATSVRPTEIRLEDSVFSAALVDGSLRAGALSRLLAAIAVDDDTPPPRVVIDRARATIDGPWGAVELGGSAIHDGDRWSARGTVRADRISGPTTTIDLVDADVEIEADPTSVRARAHIVAARASVGGVTADEATAELEIRADPLQIDPARPMSGSIRALVRAATLRRGGLLARGVSMDADLARVRIEPSHSRVASEVQGDLAVGSASVAIGDAIAQGLRLDLAVHLVSPRAGRPRTALAGLARVDRLHGRDSTLNDVRAELEVGASGADVAIALNAALEAELDSGERIVVTAYDEKPVYEQRRGVAGGAFELRLRKRGRVRARVRVPSYTLHGDVDTRVAGRATIDLAGTTGPIRHATARGQGRFAYEGGKMRFWASRCAELAATRVDAVVSELRGRLCPSDAPLWTSQGDHWLVHGFAESVEGSAPSLGLVASQGGGRLRAANGPSGLELSLDEATARVVDTKQRFRPAHATGAIRLGDHRWAAQLSLGVRDRYVARLELRHDATEATGMLRVDAPALQLGPDALQPADLSPAAERLLGHSATGEIDVSARVRWGPEGTESRGRARTRDLSFHTPAGAVSGLAADVELTNLSPLTTARDQIVSIRRVDGTVRVEDARAAIELEGETLTVRDGSFRALGGNVTLDTLRVPTRDEGSWRGRARLDAVQIGDLLKGTEIGDKLTIDARVDGTVSFAHGPDGFHIAGGHALAVAPGRLSIDPAALTGVSALAASGATSSSDDPANIAQQALQDLAFDRFEASARARPDGRLAIDLRVHGRHDPPQRRELAITWRDLLRRKLLPEPLHLPSDTEIDLTLVTDLNLADLLRATGWP